MSVFSRSKAAITLVAVTAAGLIHASASAQSNASVFGSAELKEKLKAYEAQAKGKGSGGGTLQDYGNHDLRISVRTVSGGAEIHPHSTDIFIVTGGRATLVTGATIVDAKTVASGDVNGPSIQDGIKRELAPGDIVNIPSGVAHQLIIPKGVTYSSYVIKVKDTE